MRRERYTPVSVPGIRFVQEQGGIAEYQVRSNGLRVLLAPDTSAPVAGVMVTYHVGSRNEATGYTGATHLLEHLLFKGSTNFTAKKEKSIDKLLESRGASINATTWFDRTNYYEVFPKETLPLALEIEADRMRGALFTEGDRRSEMPIVRNEYEGNENDPIAALDKAIWSAAFIAHPYHHSTIGWKSDIEGVSIERLRQFYDDFYWPDNATLTVAGNITERDTLRLVQKLFGKVPKKDSPYPRLYTEEPPQEGQRRVIVRRAGNPIVGIAHKIPEGRHPDLPALTVLASIMYDDKTSRLYRAFIDTALATGVIVYYTRLIDPGLFQTFLSLGPKLTHEKAEALLLKEYERVARDGVTAKEVAAAKRSYRVTHSYTTDGPYALLSALNSEIAIGDWTGHGTFPEAVAKVTVKDVQRVARTYFVEDQSTVGWFIPKH